MTLVEKNDELRVAAAIAAAERNTSGEIVAVITSDCGTYRYAPILWAALAALSLPWPLIYWTWIPVQHIYAAQIMLFVVLAIVLMWRPIRYAIVPRSVKRKRAHRRAVEQFLTQNLHTTEDRTGVLVFVSVAERYAEILADAGIHKKVAESEWQAIVDKLTTHIGDGRAADGFVVAIEAVGARLAEHFPPMARDPSELPNHLIVLPSG